MQKHDVVPNSESHHTLRSQCYCASDAPKMMGVDRHETRLDLLSRLATGGDVTIWGPAEEAGRRAEENARTKAESVLADYLEPAVITREVEGLSRPLLASPDGLSLTGDTVWEHKLRNRENAFLVARGEIPPWHMPQLLQQLYVSGAQAALFSVGDEDGENFRHAWLYRTDCDFQPLIEGWRQFDKDLSTYEHPDYIARPTAPSPENLPVLHVEVREWSSIVSNLAEWREAIRDRLSQIPKTLDSDADFVLAKETTKALRLWETDARKARERLFEEIDPERIFRGLEEGRESLRSERLRLEKLLTEEGRRVRKVIADEALSKLWKRCADFGDPRISGQTVTPDTGARISEAMKGYRTVQSLRAAADQVVADCSIELEREAERVRQNLAHLHERDLEISIPDLDQLVRRETDAFRALLQERVRERESHVEREIQRKTVEPEPVGPTADQSAPPLDTYDQIARDIRKVLETSSGDRVWALVLAISSGRIAHVRIEH